MPELVPAAKARQPKQGENESKEAFQRRKDAFFKSLGDSDFQLKDGANYVSVWPKDKATSEPALPYKGW